MTKSIIILLSNEKQDKGRLIPEYYMNSSHRIVLNTVATYTRSVIGAALALFSSRWILNALGETDYGLFSVVGSMIIFIMFLNTVMAGSAARHFAFSDWPGGY